METYFSDRGVVQAIDNKLSVSIYSKIINWLGREVSSMPSTHDQLIHMDFVRGNILFSTATDKPDQLQEGNVRMSGIIDFEKVSFGNPAHDIARTLAFLLVDCKYKTTAQVRKYFLKSGYQKRGGGTIENLEQIDKLVVFYLLHDFYKFLLHNPYESLKDNQHYIRTRDILLSQKVLQKL
jgi:Ser/Thr protein kinase RdoA (MazF antagonist)